MAEHVVASENMEVEVLTEKFRRTLAGNNIPQIAVSSFVQREWINTGL